MAKHFGLDPDKDMKFVAVGAVESRFIRLTQGLLDADDAGAALGCRGEEEGV